MDWMVPAIISNFMCTSILSFIYLYLYVMYRERFMKIWGLSWVVYSMRYVLMMAYLATGLRQYPLFSIFLITSLINGIMLVWGTYAFIGRRTPRGWFVSAAVILIVTTVTAIAPSIPDMFEIVLIFEYLAVAYILTGISLIRYRKSREMVFCGALFILWGLHKADYPFLYDIPSVAPWGYMIGAMFELLVAMSLLLIYFQRVRGELSDREKQYSALVDDAPFGIFRGSLDKAFFSMANPALAHILGYGALSQLLGIPVNSLFDNSCDSQMLARRLRESGRVDHTLVRLRKKDGSTFWAITTIKAERDPSGEISSIEGIVQDITEHKESEDAFRAIIETTIGFIGTDCFDNAATTICTWFGVKAAVIVEISHIDNAIKPHAIKFDSATPVNPDRYVISYDTASAISRKGFICTGNEIAGEFPDEPLFSDYKPNGFTAITLTGKNGDPIGLIYCVSDREIALPVKMREAFVIIATRTASELERIIEDNKRYYLEEQLLQAQKMEAVGRLAGGVAHDYNNMLGIIIGFASLAKSDVPPNSPAIPHIDRITDAARRSRDLTQKLLSFSRKDKVKVSAIRTSELIDRLMPMIQRSIPKNVTLSSECPQDSVIKTDENQMLQVLLNLANNSADAMPAGGSISITCSTTSLSESASAQYVNLKPGAYCTIEITDTGTGIPPNIIKKVFDPFFTTKEKDKGTGLGLATSLAIVQSHNGHIHIVSRPGNGTTMKIFLPAINISAASEDSDEDLPAKSPAVLVVDDEISILRITTMMLEKAGFSPFTAESGEIAIDLYKKYRHDISIAIIDLLMPRMDGFDTYRQLMQIDPALKVIFISGIPRNAATFEERNISGATFLVKPFSFADITTAIASLSAATD